MPSGTPLARLAKLGSTGALNLQASQFIHDANDFFYRQLFLNIVIGFQDLFLAQEAAVHLRVHDLDPPNKLSVLSSDSIPKITRGKVSHLQGSDRFKKRKEPILDQLTGPQGRSAISNMIKYQGHTKTPTTSSVCKFSRYIRYLPPFGDPRRLWNPGCAILRGILGGLELQLGRLCQP
jgi:hypothetical protein